MTGGSRAASVLAAAGAILAALLLPADALAHGDRVPVSELGGAWQAEPPVLASAALLLGLFAQGFLRLRRRGRSDHAGWDRALLFALGIALGTLALVSPLDAVGEEYLLSAHMLQHVLIGDAAPALVLAAVRGPLLLFLLPAAVLRPLARAAALRWLLALLLRPEVSFAVWAAAIAAWHIPAAYDSVLTNPLVHDLEHVSFVVGGTLAWAQLVDPARRAALTRAGRIGFAVLLYAGGQVLAGVLIFSFTPLYPAYAAQDERLLGLSPLLDQQLAGLVMMLEQTLALGTCAAFLVLAAHRWAVREEEREEPRADRGPAAPLPARVPTSPPAGEATRAPVATTGRKGLRA